ncbi:MAG: hypothetical protein AB8B88_04355 [Devosiaceae bacterium]
MSMELLSIPISVISLVVSVGTFWLVYFRRGRLKMTTPTVVFFGYDHTPTPTAKVFVRTLLYSSASRGSVVEGMYARLTFRDEIKTFNFWGYGESEKLTVGSGLYVSQSGFAANHHFVASVADDVFQFGIGKYEIEIFARQTGKRNPTKLESIELDLDAELVEVLKRHEGVLFERSLDGEYVGHGRGFGQKGLE